MDVFMRECNAQRLDLCPKAVRAAVADATAGTLEDDIEVLGQAVHDAVVSLGWCVRSHKTVANGDTYFQGGVDCLTVVRADTTKGAAGVEALHAKSARLATKGVDFSASPSMASDAVVVVPFFAEHWRLLNGSARYNDFLEVEAGLEGVHFVGTAAKLWLTLDTLERLARGVFGDFYPPWRTAYCWKHMLCNALDAAFVTTTEHAVSATLRPRSNSVQSTPTVHSMCTPRTHPSSDDLETLYFSDDEEVA
eukprot:TRINITY_DN7944_c0_g2_i8.p1 TRINITY_DN7944_c0_g2~~TRINITY_DN7944_c0_g2_i8.p1  ORF type:complete len:250 (+),score=98.53 TRINITY_DN7944_c0_g2_i8:47-796(+)